MKNIVTILLVGSINALTHLQEEIRPISSLCCLDQGGSMCGLLWE